MSLMQLRPAARSVRFVTVSSGRKESIAWPGRSRRLGVISLAMLGMLASLPAQAQPPNNPLQFVSGPWDITFGFEGGVQTTGERGSWWNLAATTAPGSNYRADRGWAEAWFKPLLKTSYSVTDTLQAYGGLAIVGTGTLGRDVFEEGNTGRLLLENAYAGARWSAPGGAVVDVSLGQQDYRIGSGMLIATGAGNGFERGALLMAPRTAWQMTGIAKVSIGNVSIDGFYLAPNELRSSDSMTRLAGAKTEVQLGQDQYAGLAYINVLSSAYPSIQAPLTLIPDGRSGMSTLHGYGRFEPFSGLPSLWIAGEFAYQWNDRINQRAYGGQGEIGYRAQSLPFAPAFSYAYRYFSGDDPATARNERFDPLYYAGSPPLWATGGNGSLAFYNSNVSAHRFRIDLALSKQDFLKLWYWYIDAAQLNSPVQFGQAARLGLVGEGLPSVVVGVQRPHLSDDYYVEFTRVLSANLFWTVGVALSVPGEGLKGIAPGKVENWWGGYTNLSWRF
ncbi:hypothetical protein [Bradyrhizobium sp. USDA 4353]